MNLIDIPFNHTNGLSLYSDLITNSLNKVQHNLKGQIKKCSNPSIEGLSSFSEDFLDYWGASTNKCTFGRHLEYTKDPNPPIPFWVFWDLVPTKSQFIILFQEPNLNSSLHNLNPSLEQRLASVPQNHTGPMERNIKATPHEFYFALDGGQFDAFCTPPHLTNNVEQFLYDVLSQL